MTKRRDPAAGKHPRLVRKVEETKGFRAKPTPIAFGIMCVVQTMKTAKGK
jgi:hypothetical protein